MKYTAAAASVTAATMAADSAEADLVFLDLSASPITSAGSIENFVDILPFAKGATAISVTFSTNSFSGANPLAPNSEFMIRGAGGGTQVRGNNGAQFGYYTIGAYYYVQNVGAVGNFATAFDGANNLTMYYDGYGGPIGFTPGIAHFTFTNTGDGQTYNGWLELVTEGTAGARQATLNGIWVDTQTVPEPTSGMALLCLGAAGIAGYRRRRESDN
ncbi:MAG: PEP-CTERM sorting domain-containing protein [Pirellulaceae bacterium]